MIRVLLIHNYYQQPGGEDAVFAAEAELLRQQGHAVGEYTKTNSTITRLSGTTLTPRTLWTVTTRQGPLS